jgi:hypothetical protein
MEIVCPKERLGSADGVAWLRARMAEAPELSRYVLAREACARLDWRDERGRLREMACRKELLGMHRRGAVVLPAARRGRPVARASPPRAWPAFAGSLAELGPIALEPVRGGTAASATWNALMDAYHPLKRGPLCGAQMRYLIISPAHGVVGGLAVSAAAWRLSPREAWLGWSDAERARGLSGIVCNSRFLILPEVRVKHLASHALALLRRRVVGDWRQRYGVAPWLMETYVEISRSGTSYRADNWIEVGMTAGRGRQDRAGTARLPPKRVFLHPLDRAAVSRIRGRDAMGASAAAAGAAARPIAGEMPGWVHREFGGAPLRDRRLQRRLLALGAAFFAKPLADIPQACGSDASAKAAYRFFDNEKATMQPLMRPHRDATIERMRTQAVALVVQDTTSLNYTTRRAMQGIGPIGTKANGPQGLHVHNTLAFATDGTPLGILDVDCWRRDPDAHGKKHERHTKPIEEKESRKWIDPLPVIHDAVRRCPNTRIVVVADREADIYELFLEASKLGLDLLVRAKQNRALDQETQRLWPHMLAQPVLGEITLPVPRHPGKPARIATMTLRAAQISLAPPGRKAQLPPLRLWAVLSKEQDPPNGVPPLEWMLLTTVPVTGLADALERVNWYLRRWGVEVFHRELKSGCRIEDRQLADADRMQACLAIDMVVAWRIHHLTWLGRAHPDLPCTVVFEDDQWKAVAVFTTHKPPPEQPPSLAQFIRQIAKLGGFLGRKADGNPGTETLWRGLQTMDIITATRRAHLAADPGAMPQPP